MESEELPLMNAPEMKKQTVIAVTIKENSILNYSRYFNLDKLINIIVYVLRFIKNIMYKSENKEINLEKVTLQK